MSKRVLVLDNGGSTIKVGFNDDPSSSRIVSNAVVRSKGDKSTYYGHEIEKCEDYASLHYRLPFEKGYLVDWDAQKAIWDGLFSEDALNVDGPETTTLITEPYFNLPNMQEVYDQFMFEEYDFQAYHRCTPASIAPYGPLFALNGLPPPECMVIIDSGFSFTHVVPILSGEIVWRAVKRLDVGGKLLTNHLKELISFRQWNMMDETYIMNQVKESCCYVSANFEKDMETCRKDSKVNPIVREYILPDLSQNKAGRIRHPEDIVSDKDQILLMNNERFSVPEIIFRPDNVGLEQAGLAETVALSISLLPSDLCGMFWANIGLVGGNASIPGFRERLSSELRTLAPTDSEVVIYECNEPATAAYHGALTFTRTPLFQKSTVTRAEYLESGSNACRRKFKDWKTGIDKGKGKQREDPEKKTGTSRRTNTMNRNSSTPVPSARRR